jgi:hypothetical protein
MTEALETKDFNEAPHNSHFQFADASGFKVGVVKAQT